MREFDAIQQVRHWLAEGPHRAPAAVQALDLRDLPTLETDPFDDSLFLGCQLTDKAAGNLSRTGAFVLPDDPDRPFKIHRSRLYTPEELFAGFDPDSPQGWESTYDYEVYDHYVRTGRQFATSIAETLARRLHDHWLSDALVEALRLRPVVAIMGGHGMERGDPMYRTVARIARRLTLRGYMMLSGGGPGAMEATHLGAWFGHFGEAELDAALEILRARPAGADPGKEYADPDWLHRAFAVRNAWSVPDPQYLSIGIPTWMYGHEPPNVFATHIAKYFANSVREEGLLAVADHGVIFAPGSAGTTQEIFQEACQNHYGSFGSRSPMILLGTKFWTETRPIWPVLKQVARGQIYDELLFLTDSEDAVVRRIRSYNPEIYKVE
jgi:predicted Rossmann-fold nucleotide-binding protein